jgi:hypothetical protein
LAARKEFRTDLAVTVAARTSVVRTPSSMGVKHPSGIT